MTFIIENRYLILAAVAFGVSCGHTLYRLKRLPKNEQLSLVRQWLLYAVIMAEAQFGEKAGQKKLKFVYDQFVRQFPGLAKLITFEAFSALTDEALDNMRQFLADNENANAFVKGGSSCRE